MPDDAVDAQSLIALADLVVSAGGTMNREAVALGTPVYTTYGGSLGGVDELLIREGRLRPLTDPRAIEIVKQRGDGSMRSGAIPRVLVELILERCMSPDRARSDRAGARLSAPPDARRRIARRALRADGAHASSRGRSTASLRALDLVLAGVGARGRSRR